jgi:hypothetical protein
MATQHSAALGDVLVVAGGVLFWMLAYALMFRRGLKDRSFGMPLSALCVNIPWEIFYGVFADVTPMARGAALSYLVPDALVLWTCLKYGPDDFDSPLLKRSFRYLAAFGMIAGAMGIWAFHVSFQDQYGAICATFTTALSVLLLLAMLLRRNSVRGQSFYIGLSILLGNLCGWKEALLAQQTVQPNIPVLWVHVANSVILLTGIVYLAVYVYVSRRDGINLWTRW